MPNHPFTRITGLLMLAAAIGLSTLHAQQPATDATAALFGSWTLNRQLSSTPPAPDTREEGSPDGRPAGWRGASVTGGTGASGGGTDGPTEAELKRIREANETIRELMTPTGHWVITSADGETITFSDAEGRSFRYVANNKKEKHQIASGTIETKTRWEAGLLRQEIVAPAGVRVSRIFAASAAGTPQLVVTTTLDSVPPGPAGVRRPPVRMVYDKDADR